MPWNLLVQKRYGLTGCSKLNLNPRRISRLSGRVCHQAISIQWLRQASCGNQPEHAGDAMKPFSHLRGSAAPCHATRRGHKVTEATRFEEDCHEYTLRHVDMRFPAWNRCTP